VSWRPERKLAYVYVQDGEVIANQHQTCHEDEWDADHMDGYVHFVIVVRSILFYGQPLPISPLRDNKNVRSGVAPPDPVRTS
jgi:hypothetical protein